MKILLVIDHFGSGGAQKQIVTLAVGLKRKGFQVEIFNYYSSIIFFREQKASSFFVCLSFLMGLF